MQSIIHKRCMMIIIITLGVISQAFAATEGLEKTNLKLYVSFDKSAAPDIAESGCGIKKNENAKLTSGKYGSAVDFARTDEDLCNLIYNLGDVFDDNDWTIALWVKLKEAGNAYPRGKGHNRNVFRTYTSGHWGDGDIFSTFSHWGRLSFDIFAADGKQSNCIVGGKAAPAGKWTHFAYTCKNGIRKIFINGYEARYQKNNVIKNFGRTQKYLRLGNIHSKGNSYLDGAIDELKVFDKAIDQNEVNLIMNTRPIVDKNTPKPTFYLPLEKKLDATTSNNEGIPGEISRVSYAKAVIGYGALLMRLGYDARTVLSFPKVNNIVGKEMTASFYFIPREDPDKMTRGLLVVSSKDLSWSVTRTLTHAVFTVDCNNKQNVVQIPVNWKKGIPVSIVVQYTADKMMIIVDGKKEYNTNITLNNTNGNSARLTVGDIPSIDRYEKSQAEGIIDEVRVFDVALSTEEIEAESLRKDNNAEKLSNDVIEDTIEVLSANDKEKELWELSGAYKEKTPTREKICLNALWRFQLATNDTFPGNTNWHYLAIPGRYSGHENGRSDHQFLIRDKNFKTLSDKQLWNGKRTLHYRNAWFERTFKADPNWKTQNVTLRFDDVGNSANGILYLNGKRLAALSDQQSYEISIPIEQLKFNADNHLMLYLYDDGGRWGWRGVRGDTWLIITPKVVITDPYVITSLENKDLTIHADVKNNSDQAVTVNLNADIKGENGFTINGRSITINAGETKQLTVKRKWENPRLWDTNDPYLYDCSISLTNNENELIDEIFKLRFGFREFKIVGADYVLNNKKIHLLNHDSWQVSTSNLEWCREYVRLLKSLGYNSIRGAFSGKNYYKPYITKACDEEGMLYFISAGGVGKNEFVSWNNPETKKSVEKKIASTVKEYRNHPSVVMWYLSINFLGYGWDFHPLKMADGYLPKFGNEKFAASDEAAQMLKKYDNTRPYFMQAGGAYGPVINSNAYFCWWPEAEKIAWAQEWSKRKSGNKPLHIIETSFPYWASLMGMDLNLRTSKPYLLVENSARYFGPSAYANLDKKWFTAMQDPAGKSYGSALGKILGVHRQIKLLQDLKTRMLVPTIQHWRGSDISGINPFAQLTYGYQRQSPYKDRHRSVSKKQTITDFRQPGWHQDILKVMPHADIDPQKPLPYLKSIKQALAPLLVYVGGGEGNPTSLDHSWFSGTSIEKSIIMVNDKRQEQKLQLVWKLKSDSKTYAQGEVTQILGPGEVKHLPVKITAPEVDKATECMLVVEAQSPDRFSVNPFKLKIFPKIDKREVVNDISTNIGIYDTQGITTKAMSTLGITAQKLTDIQSLEGIQLLIIGRGSLDLQFSVLAEKLRLSQRLQAGDINLVVFEQSPKALKLVGMKAKPIYSRNVFKSETKNPILNDLTDYDLSWLRGHGTLAPEFQEPNENSEMKVKSPLWHWTNANMAASYPILRPTKGKFQALLSTGMDLLYTPLLEMNGDKGKVLFCQMEISNRVGNDPIASVLFTNIIKHYSKQNLNMNTNRLYVNNDITKEFISTLGYIADKVTDLETIPNGSVLICDPMVDDATLSKLKKLTEKKITVVFMPLTKESTATFGLKIEKNQLVHRYQLTESGKELLSPLDARNRFFRYGQEVIGLSGKDLTPLTAPSFAYTQKINNGRFIFIQLDPFAVDDALKRDMKVGDCASSNYWANYLVKERLLKFWSNLLGDLGCPADSIALRFEKMNNPSIIQNITGNWKFSVDPDNTGVHSGWSKKSLSAENLWKELKTGYWESHGITQASKGAKRSKGDYNGYAWYRKTIKLTPELVGKKLTLSMKAVDDYDWTYVNGELVGKTGKETAGYWAAPRDYTIPAELTQAGKVTIAIRVFDARGFGGVIGPLKLSAAQQKSEYSFSPYAEKDTPKYNTEKHHRW